MKALLILPLIALTGCTGGGVAAGGVLGAITTAIGVANQVVADGQLVCNIGSSYYAMSNALGQPVLVTGQTADAVKAVCAEFNLLSTPVAPPPAATVLPATVKS